MMTEPIVECAYGWGRMVRLYQDHLSIHGCVYKIAELITVHLNHRRFLGFHLTRVELCFKREKILLRGIAEHLAACRMAILLEERLQQRKQASMLDQVKREESSVESESYQTVTESAIPTELIAPLPKSPIPSHQVATSVNKSFVEDLMPSDASKGDDLAKEAVEKTVKQWDCQREILERRRQRLRRLRSERIVREHGFDLLALALRLRTTSLARVEVPVSLRKDEFAHYYTEALLCGDLLEQERRTVRTVPSSIKIRLKQARKYYGVSSGDIMTGICPRYCMKDQGLLILTNQRVLYVGRLRQMSLSYERLFQVTRSHNLITLLADRGMRHQTFELQRPLEFTMYLEYILQRYLQLTQSGRLPVHIVPVSVRDVQSARNSFYNRRALQ